MAIDENWHAFTWGLVSLLKIPKSTIHRILRNELKVHGVCSTSVPHFLTIEQMQTLAPLSKQPDLRHRVITSDEAWVHYFNPLIKWESEIWRRKGEPGVKKMRQQKSAGKVMLIAFFDYKGLIYQHFCPLSAGAHLEFLLSCNTVAFLQEDDDIRIWMYEFTLYIFTVL